ncbi:MAG: ABC transporter permease [Crocinitomicaceae bacterium]
MHSIFNGLIAERQKVKGTFTVLFTILGSILIPLIVSLTYLFRYQNFIPEATINPWTSFVQDNIKAIVFLLFPMYVILAVAINMNIEHKANSWKKLFVLPIKEESIYLSKLLFLLLQIFTSLIIFSLSIFIFGGILGLVHHELKFLEFEPNILSHGKSIFRIFISVLGIISIQYVLGLVFKNITVPVSFGLFLTIIASIITSGWKYSIYFPYSFPSWFFINSNQTDSANLYFDLTISEISSFTFFIVVNLIGIKVLKLKKIK